MFIGKTTRRYKDRVYTNYLLVQSVLTEKGPRQKVICSLGDLSPLTGQRVVALVMRREDLCVRESARTAIERIITGRLS